MTTLIFRIPQETILNSNQRLHFHETARRTRILRNLAYTQTLQETRRPFATTATPCNITVTITPPTRRRFDPPNLYPTVKALIDGMTDAGAWADDSHEYISALTFRYGDENRLAGHYLVEVTITRM